MATVTIWKGEIRRGLLPDICLRCGADATTTVREHFRWYPPWVNVLILVGLLPWAIVAMILTKTMTVAAPMCEAHRGHWRTRKLIAWLPLLGLLGVLGAGVVVEATAGRDQRMQDVGLGILVIGCLAFVGWLIVAAIVLNGGIRPSEITDRTITLTGVSRDFVDALEDDRDREEEEERREDRKRRQAGRDWEGE